MALQDDIQNVGNVLKDIGGVVDQGLSIFSNVKKTFTPTAEKPAEPIAAKASVEGQSSVSSSGPIMLVAILVVGYLLFSK